MYFKKIPRKQVKQGDSTVVVIIEKVKNVSTKFS